MELGKKTSCQVGNIPSYRPVDAWHLRLSKYLSKETPAMLAIYISMSPTKDGDMWNYVAKQQGGGDEEKKNFKKWDDEMVAVMALVHM